MSKDKYKLIRGMHPFVTIEEMRRNPDLQFSVRGSDTGGARFEGSTTPSVVAPYCPKGEPVLECGPVYGNFTAWLKKEDYTNIHTLDFVDMLPSKEKEGVTSHVIDFSTEKFPYSDSFFGSAIAWGVIEHLENPHHFIREAHRTLKDDGYLLLSVPNALHIISRLRFLRRGRFPRWNVKDNHIALFPRGIFEKSFLRHFDLIDIVYTHPNLNLYSNEDKWYLPNNEWFGNYAAYVLRKKKFIPYA